MFLNMRQMVIAAGVVACSVFADGKASAQPPPPPGEPGGPGGFGGRVDVSVFYESLAPYGEWVFLHPYGWVWAPYDISPDWRPYYLGYWVWTDFGWTWVSHEPFGWATYHYGRWHYSPFYGWVWVPGRIWGPAWVAWRQGDGFLGWAALPPDGGRPGFGPPDGGGLNINININVINSIKRFSWNFVEENRFCEQNLRRYIVKPVRNVHIVNQTNNITNYSVVNNNVVNNSISLKQSQSKWGNAVQQYRIRDTQSAGKATVQGNSIQLFRPRIADDTPKVTPDKLQLRKNDPKSPPVDWNKQRNEDKSALDRRFESLRRSLEDRQKREMDRAKASRMGKLTAGELQKRHEMERDALKEQMERESKLLTRDDDRAQKGQTGPTGAKSRKYRIRNDD